MTLTSGGGVLHSTWIVETDGGGMTSMSDRSLKENIQSLHSSLRSRLPLEALADDADAGLGGVTEWLLQQMRPVSYNMKNSSDSELRFGFIADEMADTLPDVTREQIDSKGTSGIVYQDLIAVLTKILQDLGSSMAAMRPRVESVEERIQRRHHWNTVKKERQRNQVLAMQQKMLYTGTVTV